MITNTTTDVRIEGLEKSIILPKEVIDFADKEDIFIPYYLEFLANALYAREMAKMDYKKRIISVRKFLFYLIDAISLYERTGHSPEEIASIMEDFTYDDFLRLFGENGYNVHWYRLFR